MGNSTRNKLCFESFSPKMQIFQDIPENLVLKGLELPYQEKLEREGDLVGYSRHHFQPFSRVKPLPASFCFFFFSSQFAYIDRWRNTELRVGDRGERKM